MFKNNFFKHYSDGVLKSYQVFKHFPKKTCLWYMF